MAKKEQKQWQKQFSDFTAQNQQQQGGFGQRMTDTQHWGDVAMQTYGGVANGVIDPNSTGNKYGATGLADYSKMVSGLYSAPGYTEGEQRGIRMGTVAPVASAFGTAAGASREAAARTGNPGAMQANEAELAREKSRTMAPMLSGLQGQFADARRQDQQTAITAQGQIPGMAAQQKQGDIAAAQLYQFQPQMLYGQANAASGNQLSASGQGISVLDQLNQQAMKPGFWSQLAMAGMQGAGTALTGMATGGITGLGAAKKKPVTAGV